MKTTLCFLLIALSNILSLQGQTNLLNVCSLGGDQFGTIIKYTAGDTVISGSKNLTGIIGGGGPALACTDINGNIYGVTNSGGVGKGTIFEYNPTNNIFTTKYIFSGNSGETPCHASLVRASNNKLYGLTSFGGDNNTGVIYEFDPFSNVYSKKIDFDSINGRHPSGCLSVAPNGKLYGITSSGGANNIGVIFEYDNITNSYTKKYDMDSAGGHKLSSLFLASNGKFYGCGNSGGAFNLGVIYEYNYISNVYTKLFDFDPTFGNVNEFSSLIQAANGKLFGVSKEGGANNIGYIFEYDIASGIVDVKVDMTITLGASPKGPLLEIANGKLLGFSINGGSSGNGTSFEFDYLNGTCVVTSSFLIASGIQPFGKIVMVPNGRLFGGTYLGGAFENGVIFEYKKNTGTVIKKIEIAKSIGAVPMSPPVLASNGKFYGGTYLGGRDNYGVIYEYDYGSNTYTHKLDLGISSGTSIRGGLIEASNGKLYGLTYSGGLNTIGNLFEYDFITNTRTVKADFSLAIGGWPYGSLIEASNGKLYGMTLIGGANNLGSIFEYDYITNTLTLKFSFSTLTGGAPQGSLMQASNGKLYGMTSDDGPSNNGTLFEYDPSTGLFTKKIDLVVNNGIYSFSALVQASNGLIYGQTSKGGLNSKGVLFSYNISSNTYTKLFDFSEVLGAEPMGTLYETGIGKLYGMTYKGGANDVGVIFEYDYLNNIYTKKVDLNVGLTGGFPYFGSFIEVGCIAPHITSSGPTSFCQGDSTVLFANGTGITSYQWNRNGNAIVGANSASHVAKTSGKYTVTVNSSGVCSLPLTSIITQVKIICFPPSPSGQRNQLNSFDNTNSKFSVYYENGQEVVQITAEELIENYSTIVIVDNLGRQIINETAISENGFLEATISCTNLKQGIYTVILRNNQQQLVERFLKY